MWHGTGSILSNRFTDPPEAGSLTTAHRVIDVLPLNCEGGHPGVSWFVVVTDFGLCANDGSRIDQLSFLLPSSGILSHQKFSNGLPRLLQALSLS